MRRGDGICPSIFPRYYHIIAEKPEACKEILAQKEQEMKNLYSVYKLFFFRADTTVQGKLSLPDPPGLPES